MLLTDVAQLNSIGAGEPVTVVIGSGAIGLYAASELAKRGRRVLVVESGGVHLGNFAPASYDSVGVPHEGGRIGRSRSLGGTTNLWGGQFVEFQPVDFAGRDWLPGSAWPVKYDEIAPFYRETYENFGIEGEAQNDDAVWKSVSSKRPQLGGEFEVFFTRWLQIPSFAILYEKQYKTSEKFSVLLGHTVVGFEGSGERITGVRVVDAGGKRHTITGETFLLAAGTIENSRLLLHGADDEQWACPWRQNQNIGAYFLDHLGCKVATVQPRNTRTFFNSFCTIWLRGNKYQPKFRLRNDVLARDRILNMQGAFGFESSVSENLVYLKQFVKAAVYSRQFKGMGDLFKNAAACSKYLLPLMWRYVKDHRIFVPTGSKISLSSPGRARTGGGEPHPPGPQCDGRVRAAAGGPGLADERARACIDRGVHEASRGGFARHRPGKHHDRPGPQGHGSKVHVHHARHQPSGGRHGDGRVRAGRCGGPQPEGVRDGKFLCRRREHVSNGEQCQYDVHRPGVHDAPRQLLVRQRHHNLNSSSWKGPKKSVDTETRSAVLCKDTAAFFMAED